MEKQMKDTQKSVGDLTTLMVEMNERMKDMAANMVRKEE